MSGYSINIEQKTLEGNNFREVLYTTQRSQLVIMTLQPGEEIGMEHHTGHDQCGRGRVIRDRSTPERFDTPVNMSQSSHFRTRCGPDSGTG